MQGNFTHQRCIWSLVRRENGDSAVQGPRHEDLAVEIGAQAIEFERITSPLAFPSRPRTMRQIWPECGKRGSLAKSVPSLATARSLGWLKRSE
jgi:hypothetical protein